MKKIPTLFARDEDTNRRFVKNEVTEGCQWVLDGEGVATRKYDGTCVMYDGWQRVHHAARVYVDGEVHTNTIEGFWSLVKRGIGGTYHSVSAEYLQSYLNEYSFRFNRRDGREPMFWAILDRAVQGRRLAAS